MPEKDFNSKQIKKNVLLSLSVQLVSFFVSLILNLILPKFICESEYSYWQTFLLYVSYVPLLHFGFLDGLMLRYSQYDYDSLDKSLIRSQFKIFLSFELFFAAVTTGTGLFIPNETTKVILFFIAFAIVSTNVFTYTSYFFQLTNRISKYAVLVLIQRLLLGVGVLSLIIAGKQYFWEICIVYLFADAVAILWGSIGNKGLYWGQSVSVKEGFRELWKNVSAGVMLLIANLSAMLLVGGAKMFVQWRYDALTFGKVAFSFNVSNLFLTFVTAASVALFPSLKRINQENLPDVYMKIRKSVTPWLFVALLTYFPGCFILEAWLPNYASSLLYLGVLLPIIVFASRVSLLTNNYLKAYRKEKTMLRINLLSVCAAFVMFYISTYILDSILFVLLSLVLVIMVRSIISEIVVMRLIKKKNYESFVVEVLLTVAFILVTMKFNGLL
ncbi:Membrane protein involved in the export of O-antigen and teichoic acid [Fibrobacter sp. UWH9]|uniref:lipopolysaccharide biosynthesis protein n=1 Tax=Fibrobacter sp. UWH9 TaxID=1896213 RepID=UPI0009223B79|nr:hypothetical protein [Fibrobacter sp. UWH9]SHH27613.1 Membrane protein involved in the export of O-antigen and teichoic acid [Fibrobacter sp. UWH9]